MGYFSYDSAKKSLQTEAESKIKITSDFAVKEYMEGAISIRNKTIAISIIETVRLKGREIEEKIHKVNSVEVYKWREKITPVIRIGRFSVFFMR